MTQVHLLYKKFWIYLGVHCLTIRFVQVEKEREANMFI